MRCFIHIIKDNLFLRDPDGEEFADLASAEKEAIQTARDLMAEELRAGNELPRHWKTLVASSDDTILISLPFGKVVGNGESPAIEHRVGSSATRQGAMNRRHMDAADQHISQGRVRIEGQRSRIARMEASGYDTAIARDLLHVLEGTLAQLIAHRRLMLHDLP